jgi:hypothetical protein
VEAAAEALASACLEMSAGGLAVLSGGAVLEQCARLMGAEDADPAALLEAIGRSGPAAREAIDALAGRGRPFDLDIDLAGGRLKLAGRSGGALAWLRIEIAAPGAVASASAPPRPSPQASRRGDSPDRALDLTIASLTDAVAVFGADQRLAKSNEAFARLWGLEPAWLAERPSHGAWLDRLQEMRRLPATDDYPAFRAEELARRAGAMEASENLWRLATGRTLRRAAQPLPDGALVLVFSDVTAELDLKGQFNQLLHVQQATLDKLSDAVAVFGSDARLRLCNDAFRSLWAFPAEALAHAPHFDDLVDYWVARVHDLSFWRGLKARITDPDPAFRAPASGEAATGDRRWLAWQSRPLPDGATLLGFSDVTDARSLQQALAEREAALDAAERLKRDFTAAVSRELRTPLTTVLGYAELLEAEAGTQGWPQRARERIAAVRSAAGDLARLIGDILALAQLDAGERRLQVAPLRLSELMAQAISRREAQANGGGVALVAEPSDEGDELEADPAALASVLDHLVDNALTNTQAGGRVVLTAERAHGEVRLSVADDGRGIPFDVQARLFERFTGIEDAGAGLGLALVKALVELHGGWVSLESEPGRGACFTCHLPEHAGRD